MNPELVKIFAPWVYIVAWGLFALRTRRPYIVGAGLLLASFVGFSQNFSLFYRELHQVIQLVLIAALSIGLARTRKLHGFNIIFLIALVFILNSVLFSELDQDATAQTINFLVMIAMTNLMYFAVKNKGGLDQILLFYANLSVLAAIIGIAEYILIQSPRIEATMANSNYFAYFVGLGFCVSHDKYLGTYRLVACAIIASAIILSGSRAALAFPALHLLACFLQSDSNWRKNVARLLAVSLVALIIFLSGSSRFSGEDMSGSDAERLIFTRIALSMAIDHPLTGIGWGRFPSEFSNYATGVEHVIINSGDVIDVSAHDRRVTHNDLTRILAELGWPAGVFSLWLFSQSLRAAYRLARNNYAFFLSCIAGTLIFSLTHNNLNSVLFWFFLLLPFMLQRTRDNQIECLASRSTLA